MLSNLKFAVESRSYGYYRNIKMDIQFYHWVIKDSIEMNREKTLKRTKLKLRNALKILDPKYDKRIINYFYKSHDDMDESFSNCLLIDAADEDEVYNILSDIGFNKEGSPYIDYGFDCTGQLFGGVPNIKEVYRGRYLACMTYHRDV